jgi:hypothetical protein
MFAAYVTDACTLGNRSGAAVIDYEYELRKNGAVTATGRIQLETTPSPGDELTLGSTRAIVEDVLPRRNGFRLILEQR